jgi:hypothetical protein
VAKRKLDQSGSWRPSCTARSPSTTSRELRDRSWLNVQLALGRAHFVSLANSLLMGPCHLPAYPPERWPVLYFLVISPSEGGGDLLGGMSLTCSASTLVKRRRSAAPFSWLLEFVPAAPERGAA